ncbi:MAG: RIP metalloprotease RseP [Deltaproteobacteria bacterium]
MLSLLAFLFVLGVLIIVHEFGHFITAKKIGVRVEEFCLGFGPRIVTKEKSGTRYTISWIPLGGYVKLAGESREDFTGKPDEYFARPLKERAKIIFMGPVLNYVLGLFCFWIIFMFGYPALTTKVGSLMEGYGAEKAGIKAGDRIVAVEGQKVTFFEEMQKIIQSKKDAETVKLFIVRDGSEYVADVKIRAKPMEDLLGKKRSVGLIGMIPADEIIKIRYGPFRSMIAAADKTWNLTILTYTAFWRIITFQLSMRESVAGPLGIYYITSQAARLGPIALLHLIAVLSISLAIFNLLPLPILDGGHIMFMAIERIRGKSLSRKTEYVVTKIGLAFLFSLVVLVTYNDIVRLYGDKISQWIKGIGQ